MATDYGNKSIVTDKLHYYMDPANKQSYIGSGTSAGSTVGTVPAGTLGASGIFSSDNGGIFDFDGATDYVQVASNGSTAGFNVSTYTICVWAKPTGTGAYDQLFSYDYTAHSPPYYAIHFRGYPTSGAIILSYNSAGSYSSATYLIAAGGNNYFENGEWNMYSATFSNTGTSSDVKIYKNETRIAHVTRTQSPPSFYDQEVWLGKANFASGQYDGGYGPCMFYQKVLTQEEIIQNYNAMKHRFI